MEPETRKMTAAELLDLYYHEMRSHLLEVAAALDRIERAGGSIPGGDVRLKRLLAAARIAVGDEPERAQRFLEYLSRLKH